MSSGTVVDADDSKVMKSRVSVQVGSPVKVCSLADHPALTVRNSTPQV